LLSASLTDAALPGDAGTRPVVLHFAPDLGAPGGIASVVRSYLEADLTPWSIEVVSSYTATSRPRQLALLARAVSALAVRPKARTAGVHVHASEGFDLIRTLLLLGVARRRRIPSVVTLHGAHFMREVGRAPRLVRAVMTRASAVTALSDEVHDAARRLGARRLSLLPNPVQLQPPAVDVSLRGQVLFAGEIGPRKGVDVLLRAWSSVHQACPDLSLLLVGPVAEPALLASLPAGVRHAGALPHSAVIDELSKSCLAVLPSRAEAMPVFLLEAMAAGVPVVATPVGAVETTVGGAGRVVPVDDPGALAASMIWFAERPDQVEEAGRIGQCLVARRFSPEAFAAAVRTLYSAVFTG
jgi:glycosyltransferase involved in cell wall biosynthesis